MLVEIVAYSSPKRTEENSRAEQQQLDEFGHFSTHSFILPPQKTTDTSRSYEPITIGSQQMLSRVGNFHFNQALSPPLLS
jgi:hypothetical protein